MDAVSKEAPPSESAAGGKARLRGLFPILLLAALCLVFSLLSPRFLSVGNGLIVAQQSVVLLVAALGMTFVIVNGSIDLSVGSIVAVSALVAAATSSALGPFALIPAVLAGLACGLINGLIFGLGKVPSFIVTLGTMVVFRGVVLFFTQGAPVSISSFAFLDVFTGRLFGIPNAVLIAGLTLAVVWLVFNHSVFGREVRAVGGGERVALLSGIKVDRVKISVFAISGLLCGLAGLLQASRAMAATAQLGQGLELDVIAAVVVGGTPLTGGIGSISGTVIGVLIISVLSNGMNMIGVNPYLQGIMKGLVLVLAVFVTIDRKKIRIIK